MKSPIEQLKERILAKRGKNQETKLTGLLFMAREFSCLGEIIGRDFEVKDSKGKLVYTIRQKPMALCQLNTLLKEIGALKELDRKIEAKKWNKKGRKK